MHSVIKLSYTRLITEGSASEDVNNDDVEWDFNKVWGGIKLLECSKLWIFIYICLSVLPSIHPSIYPSIHPSISISTYPFIHPSNYLSI